MYSELFKPFQLNDSLSLKNKIVMAPLTRCMADDDLAVTDPMVQYYARRAASGLIISEGIIIRPDGQGYINTPGLYTEQHVAGWKKVTKAVHDNGGKIFAQLWHVGRVSHPKLSQADVVAPSPVKAAGNIPRQRDLTYITPKELTEVAIQELVQDYAKAAAKAIEAGFDGIEIHGANGYLVDQFLHCHTNRRVDSYGGTPENMSRFALEVIDAIIAEIGRDLTSIRLSPAAYVNDITPNSKDRFVFDYLLNAIEKRNIAYVHLGAFDDSLTYDYLGGRSSEYLRANYTGTIIASGSYSPEKASQSINEGKIDLVSIGRPFIANPDYVEKLLSGAPLKEYDPTMLAELV